MPYARRTISTNAGRSTVRRKRLYKRRSNAMSKMRYGRQTARAQKGYILRNARLVNKLNKHYKSSQVYTDWKYDLYPNATGPTTATWQITPLTSFGAWQQVMRQNVTVLAANHTFVKSMRLSCIAQLERSTDALFYNVFLVRPRYPSANRNFVSTPFTENIDWIQNAQNPGEMVRINPSVFKVLAKKQFRIMSNIPGFDQNPDPNTTVVGDISKVTKRWEWNLNVKMKVANPSNVGQGNWKSVTFDTLPYYNKLYLCVYCSPDDQSAGAPIDFSAQAQFTCINVE